MTHLIKTAHSDRTMCGKYVFQLLRDDNEEMTEALSNVTCNECINGVKEIIRKFDNGVNNGKNVVATIPGSIATLG